MTSPWVDGESINAAVMYARTTAQIAALPQGFIGEAASATSIALTTLSTVYLGGATLTQVVPAGGRRYRVMVKANATTASGAPARYIINPTWNPGATVDRNGTTSAAGSSVTTFGASYALINGTTGTSAGAGSGSTWGTVFLAAGTYTFSVGIQRSNGGSATDGGYAFNIEVEDIGAA